MRDIKFRGKSFDNGEWVYGDYHKRAGGVHCIIKMEPDENGKVVYVVHQVAPDTIGQFTGLHDKNGKEIYEGDIVRYDMGGECEVSYCVGGGFAGFDLSPAFHNGHQLTDVEVIGNIHDNPELLNK
jgi:uncharacterized phage protein (TIGR01671 family)